MGTRRPVLPATLSLVVASVLAVGCEEASFVAPALDAGQPEVTAAASRAQTTRGVPVYWFAGPTLVPGASSKITRNDAGATSTLHTSGLTAGNAYTMWMVVFNVPGNCATSPCGEADVVPGTTAVVDVIYVAGNVVGGSGRATFSGRRATADNSKSLFAQFSAPAPGLTDPYGAEMHLIVRDHGPKIPGMVPGEIHTFEGACTPESSFGLGGGPNTCTDVQFSVHEPPS
jgi:hypothetical protein